MAWIFLILNLHLTYSKIILVSPFHIGHNLNYMLMVYMQQTVLSLIQTIHFIKYLLRTLKYSLKETE